MTVRRALFCLAVLASLGSTGCDPAGGIVAPSSEIKLPSCATASCVDGVHFAADLAASATDAPNLTVQLCRNDLCSTVQPAAEGAAYSCAFVGPLTAACTLVPSAHGLHLDLLFQGVMTGWADGDVFTIRVGLPSAVPLVDVKQAVIYTVSRPAGPDCAPVCLSASIS